MFTLFVIGSTSSLASSYSDTRLEFFSNIHIIQVFGFKKINLSYLDSENITEYKYNVLDSRLGNLNTGNNCDAKKKSLKLITAAADR